VEAKKAIKSWVIHRESSPEPTYNTSPDNRQCTSQTSNNGSSPKRHLTPRLHIPDKRCLNHYLQNNNSDEPHKFTRLCITGIVQSTEKVHVYYNKEERPPVSMQITLQPSIGYISHQMLYTMKSHINMWCIMHRQENSCPQLQNKSQSSLYTPIIISIQIGGCRVSNQMVLYYILHGLIPLASTQFLKRSFH